MAASTSTAPPPSTHVVWGIGHMAASSSTAPPPFTHVVWGGIERSEDTSGFSSSLLKGVVLKDTSSTANSLQARVRPPQAAGDEGLDMNSDGDGEVDAGPGDQNCYDQEIHDAGRCWPCIYFPKKAGCRRGDECTFCHLSHAERRTRPSKAKRDKCKAAAVEAPLEEAVTSGPGQPMGTTDKESITESYMRSLIKGRSKKEHAASRI